MAAVDWMAKREEVSAVFTPAAPIQTREFFAGRFEQLELIGETIVEVGRHGIVYGERGVGKTSMVNIVGELFPDLVVVRVAADSDDSYPTLWRKVFRRVKFAEERRAPGFLGETKTRVVSLADSTRLDDIDVDLVATTIESIGGMLVVIIDEFERLTSDRPKRLVADSVKALSDAGSSATIVLVGVARDVTGLVGEHPSVERNLRQIRMPVMSDDELEQILAKGMDELRMTLDSAATRKIIGLSQGFPHYTHLLGKYCALSGLNRKSLEIDLGDFEAAVETAIEDVSETIRNAYQIATITSRPDSIFPAVLLAAALARVDAHGTFRGTDLVDPLFQITGRKYVPGNFNYNLGKLASGERGSILEKLGTRYRFTNPLMKPFVLMKGFEGRLIGEEHLAPNGH